MSGCPFTFPSGKRCDDTSGEPHYHSDAFEATAPVRVVKEPGAKERCPDCGHPVDSIFDHVDGCPPDLGDPPSTFLFIGRRPA